MSQLTTYSLPADRAKVVELLRRAAKKLKKGQSDQKLGMSQDEIARSYGYQNWSILHKNARTMTQSQFASFAELVMRNLDAGGIHVAQPNIVESRRIKCALFEKNIGYTASEFKDGEVQAIVLCDSEKIKAALESNDLYYCNVAKVEMHKRWLNNNFFEVPLVAPRDGHLHWIEGFHQVTAAVEEGMSALPIGTSLALAQELKSLVGVSSPDAVAHPYDFSECDATVV
ncbi:hypothetical protein [Paraburkholderia tropica]|uniref:hypothetical protein n=1 Tax=Paraburkholderia tropica TaxID=92647 RepID=UPI002AB2D9BA|nr:hypothetical protein [Paraburkholderia tropica]